jgi:UDP-glucose:(heptosyl)LPS alpha-1,3-glucosyltransferase
MKTALIIDRFDCTLGGAQQWTRQFAEWLLRQGCEVHVLSRQFGKEELSMGIQPHLLSVGRSPFSFASAVERYLPRLSPDVTHDMGVSWSSDIFQPHFGSRIANRERNNACRPKWQQGIHRQLTRQLPRYRHTNQFVARQYASHQRVYIALSQMVARDIQRFHGVPSHIIHTIHNGVDIDRFSPKNCFPNRSHLRNKLRIADHEILLLIVAHNFQLKGLPTLVRAHRKLVQQGLPVRLAVCGGKHLRGSLPRSFGSDAGIWMLGPVEDPLPFYAAADIYVHPTYYDACSLVVLEAMACGLPVITTTWNGAGELISNGREGFLMTDPTDTDDLIRHLMALMCPDKRRAMGLAARALAEQHTTEQNFQQLWEIYTRYLVAPSRAA